MECFRASGTWVNYMSGRWDGLSPDFVKWLREENAKFRAIPFPLTDEAIARDRIKKDNYDDWTLGRA